MSGGLSNYDSWKTMTPAEEAGGENECQECGEATWNDSDRDGDLLCDNCIKEKYREDV